MLYILYLKPPSKSKIYNMTKQTTNKMSEQAKNQQSNDFLIMI